MQRKVNDRRKWRGGWMLLCVLLVVLVSNTAVQAKSKNQGKIGKKITWTYQEKKKTLKISGKGYVNASGLRLWNSSDSENTWLGKEAGSLPMFKKIVFQEGITEIDYRFFCLENVVSISLPKSFRKIRYCSRSSIESLSGDYDPWSTTLKTIKVAKGNKKFKVSSSALVSKNGKTLYVFPSGKNMERYRVSGKITHIGDMAFWGTDIKHVSLGDRVETIGDDAFFNSTIKEITFGKNCKKIGSNAFSGCELSRVQFPKSLTVIGEYAFQGCPFTEVVLPVNLAKVGEAAFADNKKLKKIVINGNTDCKVSAFEETSCYDDEYENKIHNPITVVLGKKMKSSVSNLCDDLGKYITFQVQQGNSKYYVKDGNLYTVRGNKLVYERKEQVAEKPASSATPSPSPSPAPSVAPTSTETPKAEQ